MLGGADKPAAMAHTRQDYLTATERWEISFRDRHKSRPYTIRLASDSTKCPKLWDFCFVIKEPHPKHLWRRTVGRDRRLRMNARQANFVFAWLPKRLVD